MFEDPYSKPLPPPAKDVLPPPPLAKGDLPPPPLAKGDLPPLDSSPHPPSPPPKITHDSDFGSSNDQYAGPPQIGDLPSFGALDAGLNIPLTPTTPSSASSSAPPSPSLDGKPKKSNPLVDLVETERTYVDLLTGIIRKVAAAWSRSNLPPPELDTMFRSIEGIYRANRSLLTKLKEIVTNPSSPKALGGLLIDDLEAPYTTYCTKFCTGFDAWDPVQGNQRLPNVLVTFSSVNPPPPSSESSVWTLDALFLIPKERLKYYRKLYARLLKSTAPGRSDHKLLLGAMDKLDHLLATVDGRGLVQVGLPNPPVPRIETEDEVVINMSGDDTSRPSTVITSDSGATPGSSSSSARGSLLSGGGRHSQETVNTSISRGSTQTLSMPISDLERRLATDRTLDIFTMQPKVVRLHMLPPNLPYKRELRFSADVTISFTPRSTGIEVIHHEGHVFLLTDLFLICERMSSEEIAQGGPDGPDMWLCYPPLAAKVLRISEIPGQDNVLQVSIMRKESLILQVDSAQQRDFMMAEFAQCIDFATMFGNNKQLPPPLPPLPQMQPHNSQSPPSGRASPNSGYSRSPSAPLPADRGAPQSDFMPPMTGQMGRSITPPAPRMSSEMGGPSNMRRSMDRGPPPPMHDRNLPPDPRSGDAPPFGPEGQVYQGPNRGPPFQEPPMFPPRSSSQPYPGGPLPPPGPGQTFTPRNNTGPFPGFKGLPSHPGPYPPQPGQPPPPPRQLQPQPPFQNMNNAPFPPRQFEGPNMPNYNGFPPGPPPLDLQHPGSLSQTPSSRSLGSHFEQQPRQRPPLPNNFPRGSESYDPLPQPRALLPSAQLTERAKSMVDPSFHSEPSPPPSPIEEQMPTGPITNTISAQMKCKVFLQQQHAQWKNLGTAKLKLYRQQPTNLKQLVVEAENKEKTILISTIVLTDGVERVGKTGVAIELSDKGARTGIIYMIQLRNENSAGGLFDSLLAGSDRSAKG